MAQFDVYRNNNEQTKGTFPYLLNIQHDLLQDLATRVVVPLIHKHYMRTPAKGLNPEFLIEDQAVCMSTAELAGVQARILGENVCSLQRHRVEIVQALDLLITGSWMAGSGEGYRPE